MSPTKEELTTLFQNLETTEGQKVFFDRVRDDVNWWIVGSTPMSKTYTSKKDFQAATFSVLNSKCFDDPLKLKLVDLTVGEDQAVAELAAIDAVCKNGLPYPMRYSWSEFSQKHVSVSPYLSRDNVSALYKFARLTTNSLSLR